MRRDRQSAREGGSHEKRRKLRWRRWGIRRAARSADYLRDMSAKTSIPIRMSGIVSGDPRAVSYHHTDKPFPMKRFLALLLLSGAFALPAFADRLLESYTARLSSQDHFNSSGSRLASAAAIIRQDRANYHKFGQRDPEDEGDRYFASASNREVLESLLQRGASTRGALNAIVNGTPLVQVSIFRDDQSGRDYVTVTVKE